MGGVLIADDSIFMRNVVKNYLKKNGFNEIWEAGNGREAIEKYKAHSPDVVTLDITMLELSGIEALREIIKFDPSAKCIMASALGQEIIIREALEAGAKDFLVKPYTEEAVVLSVRRLCETGNNTNQNG